MHPTPFGLVVFHRKPVVSNTICSIYMMDTGDFRLFVDNLVHEMQPGAVLNYFRTNRAYSRRRFYRVRLKTYRGDIRTEFARSWLILGAGVDPSDPKRPKYTACVRMSSLSLTRFRRLKSATGSFSVDLKGLVQWVRGDKPIRDVIRRHKGLRMTEEQKANTFIQCLRAMTHCTKEEAMELWSSTRTAGRSKPR
jgi:hypothetical protein